MKGDPVLFLDIDGVLNRCGFSSQGLETDKVDRLFCIVQRVDPVIVVTSTWRKYPHHMARLKQLFADIGARYHSCTKVLGYDHCARGMEIKLWMEENWTPETFVVVDDDGSSVLPIYRDQLVETNSFTGMTDVEAAEIVRRFGGDPEGMEGLTRSEEEINDDEL